MYCIKRCMSLGVTLVLLNACTGGVQSGSTASTYHGVESATALSPTAIQLKWTQDASVTNYEVYTPNSSAALASTPFGTVLIENLLPDTNYVFKVIGKSISGEALGADKEIKIKTWPRFLGILSANSNANGTVDLKLEYEYNPSEYEIFWMQDSAPTAENTNQWKTPNLTTTERSVTVTGLSLSKKYYFIIHAKYRTNEFEYTTKTISINTASSFQTPVYELVPVSIGDLPYMKVAPVEDAKHSAQFFKSQVFWKGQAISDPLVGNGTLFFSATANLPIGKIDSLSLKVTYDEGKGAETAEIEGLSTYRKGVSPEAELPPVNSLGGGTAYMGSAIATGDFNCDGGADVAVGLPLISLGSVGQTKTQAGVVYVYYTKKVGDRYVLQTTLTPSAHPAQLGVDPQIISFDDMNENANFGAALSAGNLNNDRNGQNECADLIVGAPGANTGNGVYDGAAFLFYGSIKGLQAPAHASDLQENVPTCDGKLEGSTCTAVKLWADYSLWPASKFGGSPFAYTNTFSSGARASSSFGTSLAFIGDFNADGYQDIAIGAPKASWDGEVVPGNSGYTKYLGNVGYVAIYFGSKFGLGYETPDATDASLSGPRFPFLKIYPPVPQSGMSFGSAIAGKADVDGRYKIRLNDGSLAGGADFVVGASGFTYPDFNNVSPLKTKVGSNYDDAGILNFSGGGWVANGISMGAASSFYGISQNVNVATGAAFVYFGRGALTPPSVIEIESPTRSTFWQCGRRAMNVGTHYSCMVSPQSFRMLSPRNGHSKGFGTSVALLGDPSRYDSQNALITATNVDPLVPRLYFSDSNQDGFADIAVFASSGSSGSTSGAGNVWEFFGNPNRLYESGELFNVYSDGIPDPTKDSSVNNPNCSSFAAVDGTSKQNCRPSTLESPSLSANLAMGSNQKLVSVGDVTGDGIMDLAVGVPNDTVIGAASGSVLVFTSLTAKGITSNYKKLYSTNSLSGSNLGGSVAVASINGDFKSVPPPDGSTTVNTNFPYYDVVAGAPNDARLRSGAGGLYGFVSNENSIPATLTQETFFVSDTLASFQSFGYGSTRIVGDINQDGYDDAIAKISYTNNSGSTVNKAVVYFGSPLGIISTSFCLEHAVDIFKEGQSITSECYPSSSRSSSTLMALQDGYVLPQLIDHPANVSNTWAFVGYNIGDANGDGFDDVAFLQPGGAVIVYYGSRGGLQDVVNPSWAPSINDPQIVTGSNNTPPYWSSQYERYLDSENIVYIAFGDFNKDGYTDFALTDPRRSSPGMNQNIADNTQIPRPEYGTTVNPGDGWYCSGLTPESECLAGAGIINHGRVLIFYGSRNGIQTPSLNGLVSPGTDIGSGVSGYLSIYGTETSGTKPCEDAVDPICSVVEIQNPVFENIDRGYSVLSHFFGSSIAIGDIDNDGYDDLMVGSPYYEDISCSATPGSAQNYGRVFIYKGNKRGALAGAHDEYYNFNTTGSCPVDPGDDPGLGIMAGSKLRALAPSIVNYGISTNDTDRQFGSNMTIAGDVNGDGFEDLAIAAIPESVPGLTNVGTMYLYYGPLCPPDNMLPVNQAFQEISGSNVSVNKQMYFSGAQPAGTNANLIFTGALGSTGASCYRGTGGSLKPLPQKIYIQDVVISSAGYGRGLVAGRKGHSDFNGDGYDDVLFGSPFDTQDSTGTYTDVGRGVVLFGHTDGLYASDYPANSVISNSLGQLRPFIFTPPFLNTNDQFFTGNLSIGDVNNDHTADFMVPSKNYNGTETFKGIGLGSFFLFR